jgi:hypothetical protein
MGMLLSFGLFPYFIGCSGNLLAPAAHGRAEHQIFKAPGAGFGG